MKERTCGIWVVNIQTGQTVAIIRFEVGIQEVFGVQVLQNISYPAIMECDDERMADSYILSDDALKDVFDQLVE